MARTALTPTDVVGPYEGTPSADDLDFAFTAGDAVNGNEFPSTGREVIVAQNVGAGAADFTISSVADGFGRTQDISAYSLAAGEFAAIGPMDVRGWRQTDGNIYLDVSAADIEFAILRLPRVNV